jgi:pyruvate dehydrogenase E2 component (dihydrolipoamide acetyltransferase)
VERDVLASLQLRQDGDDTGREVLETLKVAGARAVIATRMLQSATTTAPVTLTTETDATELVALRAQQRAAGIPCSYNDLLLWLLARALREHPRLNASLQGEEIRVWRRVNIGLAVDSEQGLRVPVVHDVDQKGLAEIAHETAALVAAARQGRSAPEALCGGTFTLTNLGMFGIDAFTPILNLPECALLGVGRIRPQPAVVDDHLAIRQKVWLSLTFDHRLIDGGPAARFLQRVAQLIENPPPVGR